ncbi:MAG: hypothetical protein WD397_17510 [Wenzhouxiangellaceae bacterium]
MEWLRDTFDADVEGMVEDKMEIYRYGSARMKISHPRSAASRNAMKNAMMKFVILLCAVVMFGWAGADPDSSNYVSPECPKLEDLNTTTRHYLEKSFRRMISEEEYADDLASVGLDGPLTSDDFRLLDTSRDSAICQKLNEVHGGIGAVRAKFFVRDRELGGYRASMFGIYYEVRDKYVVLWSPYNSGSDVEGQLDPPSMGWRFAIVYDKSNLTRIGSVAF